MKDWVTEWLNAWMNEWINEWASYLTAQSCWPASYLTTHLHNSVPHNCLCICLEHIICWFRTNYLYSLASLVWGAACQYLNAPSVSGKDMLSAAKCSIYVTSVSLYDFVMHNSFPLLFLHLFKALCCFQSYAVMNTTSVSIPLWFVVQTACINHWTDALAVC